MVALRITSDIPPQSSSILFFYLYKYILVSLLQSVVVKKSAGQINAKPLSGASEPHSVLSAYLQVLTKLSAMICL